MLRRASPGRWPFFKLVKIREVCKNFLGAGQGRAVGSFSGDWQLDFAGTWRAL